MMHTTTPKTKKSVVVLRLGKYLMKYKWLVFLALALTFVSNYLALLGPFLSGKAIDAIEPGKGHVVFDTVFYYCALMGIFYIISSLLSYLLSIIMIHLSQKVIKRMRSDVFNKLMELPVGYFDKLQAGDIISRISYDIDTVNASLSNDLLQICTSFITVIGSFISMLIISPVLLLVFILTLPISIVFTIIKTKSIRPLFRKRSVKLGELNGYSEEILSGLKTIKAYNREDTMIERFEVRNANAVNAFYDADYYSSMVGPSVNFINNLSLALISTAGSIFFLAGSISLGNISSFILYSRKFSGPINELANILSELQSASAAAERIFNLLDEKSEKPDAENAIDLTNIQGNVKFENVCFGYTADKTVIRNLNLQVQKGTMIAIVGPTGAGKTTLINLLMRFYDVDKGTIFLDGNDITTVTRKSLRKAYSMVLQDTWLFDGSIYENIAYGKENASREEIERAATAVGIHRFITSLPKGYDTVVDDGGVNLSKGQKQLLTIARAMLADSPILILDEATSNVDTRTELQIEEAMEKLMEGKTCFIIAHRLSTIKNADQIIVFNDGEIMETGNHRELMNQNGFYSELYRSQFA